ncbi:MICOS complex subunit MIC27-like isoform X2 [Latimeria chalumnae]|uniref:MICOS complex subunit MIC27-like isoform X2 n=1 Tax=Latimeria chalumnae TaxID=7897 RepID=UPI00313E4C7F
MAAKVVKLSAVPASLGFVLFRVYAATSETKEGHSVRPEQLSIYQPPATGLKYVEEQPGRMQQAFSAVRQTIHPYVKWSKGAYTSVRNGIQNTVHFGKDAYAYLNAPPPGFFPRVGVIMVSGLAGLVLARKGSRIKKLLYPLGLTALGVSLCYPTQAIVVAKVSGSKVYTASQWTYGAVGSLWKESSTTKCHVQPTESQDLQAATHPENLEYYVSPDPDSVLKRDDSRVSITSHKPAAEHPLPEFPFQPDDLSAIEEEPKHPEPLSVPVMKSETTEPATPSPVSVKDETKKNRFTPASHLMDHGQSNPEDADLYSTRG